LKKSNKAALSSDTKIESSEQARDVLETFIIEVDLKINLCEVDIKSCVERKNPIWTLDSWASMHVIEDPNVIVDMDHILYH